MDDRIGILAPGYHADLIMLNFDPFSCLPEELLGVHSIATMVEGKWVYSELE
jgi:predicted amidohydrolase YtcJ